MFSISYSSHFSINEKRNSFLPVFPFSYCFFFPYLLFRFWMWGEIGEAFDDNRLNKPIIYGLPDTSNPLSFILYSYINIHNKYSPSYLYMFLYCSPIKNPFFFLSFFLIRIGELPSGH